MSTIQCFNEWITLADAHILLGTTSPTDDVSVQAMIDSVDATLVNYLGRNLKHCEHKDITFRPEGSFVKVNNWPIISITSITSEGSAIAESEFDIYEDLGIFYYNANGLAFNGSQPKDITIQYISGYDPLPQELLTIFNTLLSALYDAGGTSASSTGEIKKVSLVGVAAVEFDTGGSSVAYSGVDRQAGVPESLKPYVGTLDRYRSDLTMGII